MTDIPSSLSLEMFITKDCKRLELNTLNYRSLYNFFYSSEDYAVKYYDEMLQTLSSIFDERRETEERLQNQSSQLNTAAIDLGTASNVLMDAYSELREMNENSSGVTAINTAIKVKNDIGNYLIGEYLPRLVGDKGDSEN